MAKTLTAKTPAPKHRTLADDRGEYRSAALLKFVSGLMAREDDVLRAIREETPKKGIPAISIGPDEGKLLDFLVRVSGAKKAIEVGTLAGYSAAWIARALPHDGVLHTLEYDEKHAKVARENLKRAGVASKVELHVGPALQTLPTLALEGPFDFCFIDADKVNYANYARWAVENVRPGGLVVGDNAYLFGKLHLDPKDAGEDAKGVPAMREFLTLLADEELFTTCAMIPTGEGLAVAVRK
jgi:predicted O-methyltransferase YrrM